MQTIKIALAGNPNCGKTCLFNALTGARQRVGNWPGVTVERLTGEYIDDGCKVEATDLPGIYSFSAYSIDESISRSHILTDHPDVVVNILDATNLERNLYLTTQLLEIKVPIVVALNMMDVVRKRRIKIEVEHLAMHLGCPVIPIVACRGEGLHELRAAILRQAREKKISPTRVQYDSELEKAIANVQGIVEEIAEARSVDPRWLALKLLEHDDIGHQYVQDPAIFEQVEHEAHAVARHIGEDCDIAVADGRYGFIHGLARDVVRRDMQLRRNVTELIDHVVLNRVIGIPIFLLVMYLVFVITINVGGPFIDFFDILFGVICVDGFSQLLAAMHCPVWLATLLTEGLGGGIQTVATFIPPIALMFLCLAFLEDSGYMARAAFVMDRFLRAIGLPGKAFIPMMVGFGCNVPGIMATRTLENERDRILAIMMNPLMSCGARLPIYAMFAAAFFPRTGGALLFGLYMTGIVLSIGTGMLFKRTILRGEVATFVMELPPYHLPTFGGVLFHAWNRLKSFILRAGKAIVIVVVILSFLNSFGRDGSFGNQNTDNSMLAGISQVITPVFRPMGIEQNNWQATVGLFTGIFAKEVVVGTLDALYSTPGEKMGAEFDFWGGVRDAFLAIPRGFEGFWASLIDPLGLGAAAAGQDVVAEELQLHTSSFRAMSERFNGQAGAIAYLLFILIYAPCLSTLATIYRETNLNWAIFSVSYLTGLAWIVAVAFYQLYYFHQHPGQSVAWLIVCAAALIGFYAALHFRGGVTRAAVAHARQ
ncbi:Fe(2+) transporter permease subunit FeoB [Candidatus Sumerlaeota bacterium]|nr:Fe(2+) transporter permease subunit FeoB [Candidatus Sumerlaeota bacterium]